MEKVLDALMRSENALLESPTGTGKTLCLLCAALAWQREQARSLPQNTELTAEATLPSLSQASSNGSNNNILNQKKPMARVPTILYASRTHSQLSQVVRELRNTRYRPKHTVLGSREQMCVNPKVKTAQSTASDINNMCNKLGKDRKCRFRQKLENFTPPTAQVGGATMQLVMDMEDLLDLGKTEKICPFYYTRNLVSEAELILIPYNYLFDKDARESTLAEIPWNNTVVIFDEAHNLESFASDSASFDLSSIDVAGCISEVDRALNLYKNTPDLTDRFKVNDVLKLKSIFLHLEEFILNLPNQNTYAGEYMMEIFSQGALIDHNNHQIFINQVRKLIEVMMDVGGNARTNASPRLEHFIQCVKRVYGEASERRCLANAQAYRVHVTPKLIGSNNAGRTVSYWCFAPSLAMQELANLNIRSFLITSGTLSPLPSYEMELGLRFPHKLENSHIITDEQILVKVVGKGVSGKLLSSAYERRSDVEYVMELGNTIVALSKVIPKGILIFFPSYGVMSTCLERWGGPASSGFVDSKTDKSNFFAARRRKRPTPSQKFTYAHIPPYFAASKPGEPSTPWKRLLSQKSIVLEPKSASDLQDAIAEFHKFINEPSGCILMGVCRGKISEGIDFKDDMCRAVVITGLPFAPAMDPKVKLKREYLDGARVQQRMKASGEGGFGASTESSVTLSGHEWYTQQAHRAVNQAIGRVIRNKYDYGAILLLDSRFGDASNRKGLSKWVQPHFKSDDGVGSAIRSLVQFYTTAKQKTEEIIKAEPPVDSRGIVLAFEEDIIHEEVTKIAVVRKSSSEDKGSNENTIGAQKSEDDMAVENDDEDNSFANGYVPPDRVIARLDVKDLETKRNRPFRPVELEQTSAQASSSCGLSRLYEARQEDQQITSTSNGAKIPTKEVQGSEVHDTKTIAAQFFTAAKAAMSPTEQTQIRKLVVAMKIHGDKRDTRSYLRSAEEVVAILVRYDSIEMRTGELKESGMLELFLSLLPQCHRREVELVSLRLSLDQSSLRKLCDELTSDSWEQVKRLLFPLLCNVWLPRDIEYGAFSTANYLKEVEKVLDVLLRSGKAKLYEALLKLMPTRLRTATNALFSELQAAKNIARIKQGEKARNGENGIQQELFHPTKQGPVVSLAKENQPVPDQENERDMKAALMRAEEINRLKRENLNAVDPIKADKLSKNPYYASKKKALSLGPKMKTAPQTHPANKTVQSGAKPKPSPDAITKCLASVQSDVFVKRTRTSAIPKLMNTLSSNTPTDMQCLVCLKAPTKVCVAGIGNPLPGIQFYLIMIIKVSCSTSGVSCYVLKAQCR
jgi:regulator of telomere elongation helicase 1